MTLRERFLAGTVLILTILMAAFWAVSPRIKEMNRLVHQKETLQKSLQYPEALGLSAPKSGSPAKEVEGESAPVSAILSDLVRLVKSHRLDLSSIKPTPPEDKGDYVEYKIGIDLEGRYRDMVEFLEDLEQQPLWMMISDVRIEENVEKVPGIAAHLSAVVLQEKAKK